MATNPLDVILENLPPGPYLNQDSVLTTQATFIDRGTRALTDPDIVTLVHHGFNDAAITETYNPGNITKLSSGVYRMILNPPTTDVYKYVFTWVAQSSPSNNVVGSASGMYEILSQAL